MWYRATTPNIKPTVEKPPIGGENIKPDNSSSEVTMPVVEEPVENFVPDIRLGEQLVSEAMNWIGTPYVWGGESERGVDCSGLIRCVIQNVGVNPGGDMTANNMANGYGFFGNHTVVVGGGDLLPGDFIFFDWGSPPKLNSVDHVGIFAGNNEIIHASSSAYGKVVRVKYSEHFKKHTVIVRRLIT